MSKLLRLNVWVGVFSFCVSTTALLADPSIRVLVLDEGIDLQHKKLSKFAYLNSQELNGLEHVDDDNNGFVDDISGWNILSNDAHFFPHWIRRAFTNNNDIVKELLGIYDRIEAGDSSSQDYLKKNPNLAEALEAILGWSHGTHVAGIIEQKALNKFKISSINMFNSSDENDMNNESIHDVQSYKSAQSREGYIKLLKDFFNLNRAQQPSIFDDRENIEIYLSESNQEELVIKEMLSRYTSSYSPRVVNISMGISKLQIYVSLQQMWLQELKQRRKPKSTRRTAAQQANFELLADGIFEGIVQSWKAYFSEHPRTLFVIAAGNDADNDLLPDAGNNGIHPVAPANLSAELPNVITVAATSPSGLIADFSNYNDKLVNVGAWGTQVPSYAPDNHSVNMSGTSMASPLVAGIATRIFQINNDLTPTEVRQIIEGTVIKKPSLMDRVSSQGLVDEITAFDAAQRTQTQTVYRAIRGAVSDRITIAPPTFSLFNAWKILKDNQAPMSSDAKYKTPSLVKDLMPFRAPQL